jgi:hypothetical protein
MSLREAFTLMSDPITAKRGSLAADIYDDVAALQDRVAELESLCTNGTLEAALAAQILALTTSVSELSTTLYSHLESQVLTSASEKEKEYGPGVRPVRPRSF